MSAKDEYQTIKSSFIKGNEMQNVSYDWTSNYFEQVGYSFCQTNHCLKKIDGFTTSTLINHYDEA